MVSHFGQAVVDHGYALLRWLNYYPLILSYFGARRDKGSWSVARRWALPAPLATTHAAFNLREKQTGRPPSDRPSSTHWEEHTRCPTLTCHATRSLCSCGPPLLAAMNPEKLAKMASQVRTGGKGSVRRKKKAIHKTTTTDDKRLQNTLKRLGVNNIPAIEEVNLFKDNGTVIHFTNPKGALAPMR